MARYVRDNAGVDDMLSSPGMQADMRARAERVKTAAEGIAPRESGEYASSFEASSGVRADTQTRVKGRRAYGRVTNTAPYAFQIEYGSTHNDRYRVLGKSLDAAGD